jgi:hypothetical protein
MVVDGFARERPVVLFDYAGVGGSSGRTPATVRQMAFDAVSLIEAPDLRQGAAWARRCGRASWIGVVGTRVSRFPAVRHTELTPGSERVGFEPAPRARSNEPPMAAPGAIDEAVGSPKPT